MTLEKPQRGERDRGGREAGVAALVVTFAAAVALLYFFAFGLLRKLPWGGPDDWAGFGDFFGGVVNPAIGLATVILVVWTLRTTRQEAAETRQQLEQQARHMAAQVAHIERDQKLAELQKRLDGALLAWNLLMEQREVGLSGRLTGVASRAAHHEGESFRSVLYRQGLDTRMSELLQTHQAAQFRKEWHHTTNEAVNIFAELSSYCQDYESVAGNRLLTDYYRRRVHLPFRAFCVMGLLPPQTEQSLRVEWSLGNVGHAVSAAPVSAS